MSVLLLALVLVFLPLIAVALYGYRDRRRRRRRAQVAFAEFHAATERLYASVGNALLPVMRKLVRTITSSPPTEGDPDARN